MNFRNRWQHEGEQHIAFLHLPDAMRLLVDPQQIAQQGELH